MPAVSVIIPYHNDPVDVFRKCLESLLASKFSDFEIIVINDGSRDENFCIISELVKIDNRIRLISQENQGVSVARNRGTAEACGDYIIYVDADDLILPSFFEEAFSEAVNTSAEIVYSFVLHTTDETEEPAFSGLLKTQPVSDKWLKEYTVGRLYQDGDIIFGRGPWARFIKSEIAKNTPFLPGVPIGEDVLWNLSIIEKTNRKYITSTVWYIYMIRDSSVTKKYDPQIEIKILPFYQHIKKFVENGSISLADYYKRVFRDLNRYIFKSNYGNKVNRKPFLRKWHEFDQVLAREPWCELATKEHWKMENWKGKLKIATLKAKLLYPIWTIKLLIKKK